MDNMAENMHSKGSMKNIMVEGKNLSISMNINLGTKNRDEKGQGSVF